MWDSGNFTVSTETFWDSSNFWGTQHPRQSEDRKGLSVRTGPFHQARMCLFSPAPMYDLYQPRPFQEKSHPGEYGLPEDRGRGSLPWVLLAPCQAVPGSSVSGSPPGFRAIPEEVTCGRFQELGRLRPPASGCMGILGLAPHSEGLPRALTPTHQ